MAASRSTLRASLRLVPSCLQTISALRTGRWPVRRICSKPACQEYSQSATSVAAASNALRPQLAKDRSQFHSFIKYYRNSNGSELEPSRLEAASCHSSKAASSLRVAATRKRAGGRNVLVTLTKVCGL